MLRNDKVLIVDGLNLFIRTFSASNTMNQGGKHVGGITGFLLSLAVSVRQYQPSRIVICFDGVGGSIRRKRLFKEYKENRSVKTRLNRFYDFQNVEEEQHSMLWQLKILKYLLQYIPCTVIVMDNVEADDVIAYLAQLVVSEYNGKAMIMSTDKDFLQLASDPNITILNGAKKKLYTQSLILADYNIHPVNFLTYRAFCGDTSDNINGVHGVKEKTLLKYFPELATDTPLSISDIIDSANRIAEASSKKVPAAITSILESSHILKRNYELMRLDEVAMSSHTRISVLDQFNAPIPKLNKLELTKAMIVGRMMSAFGNWDMWVQSSWAPISRFSGDTGE